MKAHTLTDIHYGNRITVVCQFSHQLETKLADYFVDNFEAEGIMFTRIDSDLSRCEYDVILSVYYPDRVCDRFEMKIETSDVVVL